jgi:hypothetical protein
MGLLSTVKGWLNIGGVKVKMEGVNPMVPKSGNQLTGRLVLMSKSDKHVNKVDYKFVLSKTTGRGEDKETKEYIIGSSSYNQPFDIKAGESKTLEFSIPYSIERTLKDMGGVLGAVGKLGAFAVGEKLEYQVIAKCSVKGAAMSPGAHVDVTVVD